MYINYYLLTNKKIKIMAAKPKTCPNGHQYDHSIYQDNCPFCPESSHTKVNNTNTFENPTRPIGEINYSQVPTLPVNNDFNGERTIIRGINETQNSNPDGGRKIVGLLVSYSTNKAGEIYKIYEGITTIGRNATCDIAITQDMNMSSKHLVIQYVPLKGIFTINDQGSSNGTFVNGKVYVMGEPVVLKNNDILILGGTKFIFIAIPEF